MTPKTDRRSQLVILPAMQRRLVLHAVRWPLVVLVAAALLVGVGCQIVLVQAGEAEVALPGLTWLAIAAVSFLVVAVTLILAQALVLSNRIAGPVYRLIDAMERVCQGETDFRVKLREKDFLPEAADKFNEMLDVLERRSSIATTKTRSTEPVVEPAEVLS
jgi:methyl-accepting chemotaxis protein